MSGNLNLQPGEALLVEGVVAYIGGNVDSNGKYHSLRRVEGDEIVRCRDCVHAVIGFSDGETSRSAMGCDRFDRPYLRTVVEVEPDGFCAWGRKRAE